MTFLMAFIFFFPGFSFNYNNDEDEDDDDGYYYYYYLNKIKKTFPWNSKTWSPCLLK